MKSHIESGRNLKDVSALLREVHLEISATLHTLDKRSKRVIKIQIDNIPVHVNKKYSE